MTSGQAQLNIAIEAQGGLHRWQTIKEMVAHIRCGGIALPLRIKFLQG